MSRPFGLPEKRRIIVLDEREPEEPEPRVDAVSTIEVPPDDVWDALAWAGAGPEERD